MNHGCEIPKINGGIKGGISYRQDRGTLKPLKDCQPRYFSLTGNVDFQGGPKSEAPRTWQVKNQRPDFEPNPLTKKLVSFAPIDPSQDGDNEDIRMFRQIHI